MEITTSNLKRLQEIELEILKEFDRICKNNNLDYFLDSGTAIGAVRHGGFIPWDDDLDVGMIREDYERFLRIAPKELKPLYFLQTTQTDPKCPCLFAKIRKNGTIYQENDKLGMKMHMGIWIDIFPFDFISDDEIEQKKIISKAKRYRNLFMIKKIPHIHPYNEGFKLLYLLKLVARKVVHIILQIVPDKHYLNKMNQLIDEGKDKRDYLTCLYYHNPIVWRADKIIPVTKAEFEGFEFSFVNDADYYLKMQYGNYMELPPVEKRTGHKPLFISYED